MKRAEINRALKELESMCRKHCCYLPPFCHFTPEQWQTLGHEYDEVRNCMLGWDITAFACTAAGLSTTSSGGISSVPSYEEVLQRMDHRE